MNIILGAGIAGLAAANSLQSKGLPFLLLEERDLPGGKVHTSQNESGSLADVGFQVILDSYKTLRKAVPPESLNACYFDSGAILANRAPARAIYHPWMHPAKLPLALIGSTLSAVDCLRFAKLAMDVLLEPPSMEEEKSESSALREIERRGFSKRILEDFLRPFFGGVLLDRELNSSSLLFRYYFRKFLLGRAFVPAKGMGALPATLAARLPKDGVWTSCPVSRLRREKNKVVAVLLEDGREIPCDTLVLATGEQGVSRLLPEIFPRPQTKILTLWGTTPEPAYTERLLALTSGTGPVDHCCQITNIAPAYAGNSGEGVFTATILSPGNSPSKDLARMAKDQLRKIFPSLGKLEWFAVQELCAAVPAQSTGFLRELHCRKYPDNVFPAGDLANTSSLEFSWDSGVRAAEKIARSIF